MNNLESKEARTGQKRERKLPRGETDNNLEVREREKGKAAIQRPEGGQSRGERESEDNLEMKEREQ